MQCDALALCSNFCPHRNPCLPGLAWPGFHVLFPPPTASRPPCLELGFWYVLVFTVPSPSGGGLGGNLEPLNRIKGGLDVHMAMRILTKIRARMWGSARRVEAVGRLLIFIPQYPF